MWRQGSFDSSCLSAAVFPMLFMHGLNNQLWCQELFRLSMTVSQIGLMESCLHHHYHWCGGPPPQLTPLAGYPLPCLAWECDRWLGHSAFMLTKHTCWFLNKLLDFRLSGLCSWVTLSLLSSLSTQSLPPQTRLKVWMWSVWICIYFAPCARVWKPAGVNVVCEPRNLLASSMCELALLRSFDCSKAWAPPPGFGCPANFMQKGVAKALSLSHS